MKIISFWLILAILAGCASSGVQIQPEQLQSVKVGETTCQDIIARFGRPTANVTNSSGLRIITYSFTQVRTRPESFIPIVGLVAGGADAKGNSVAFVFGPDGKLTFYSSSDVNVGAGIGISNGN